MRFWVFITAAVLVVLVAINGVVNVVKWWGMYSKPCPGEPNCAELTPPMSHGVPAFAFIVGLFALGASFVFLALRARRRRVTAH